MYPMLEQGEGKVKWKIFFGVLTSFFLEVVLLFLSDLFASVTPEVKMLKRFEKVYFLFFKFLIFIRHYRLICYLLKQLL